MLATTRAPISTASSGKKPPALAARSSRQPVPFLGVSSTKTFGKRHASGLPGLLRDPRFPSLKCCMFQIAAHRPECRPDHLVQQRIINMVGFFLLKLTVGVVEVQERKHRVQKHPSVPST